MSIIYQSRLELFAYFNPAETSRLNKLDEKWVKFFWIFLSIALFLHSLFFVGNFIRNLNIIDQSPPPLSIEIVAPRGGASDGGEEKKTSVETPKAETKDKPKPAEQAKPVAKTPSPSPIKEDQAKPEVQQPAPAPVKEEQAKPEVKQPPPAPQVVPEKSTDKSAATVDADKYADFLKNPKPPYPMGPYREGIEGVVLLRVQVLEDGSVGSVEVAQSSGNNELDESALTTVKKWRFKAAVQGGVTAAQFVRIPITFKLHR